MKYIYVKTFRENGRWQVEIVRVSENNEFDMPGEQLGPPDIWLEHGEFSIHNIGFNTREEARNAIQEFNNCHADYHIRGGLH